MKPKPMKRYRGATYPTALEVSAQPDLLLKAVPSTWRQNAVVMAALSAFLASHLPVQAGDDAAKAQPAAAVVAPIFKHGEGRGATGCVAVAPPVFLSEEEAVAVIVEELSKAGLKMTAKEVPIEGVRFCERFSFYTNGGVQVMNVPERERPLIVDLMDRERGVAVEFISRRDYFPLGGVRSGSRAQSYDFPQVAKQVAADVERKGPPLRLGLFYDPAVPDDKGRRIDWGDEDTNEDFRKATAKPRAEAKRLLRLQVKDFVDWLKGQGVI
jgi:hypothetical protein